MQLQAPFATVTPTVDGDVLEVLARTPGHFYTLSDVHRLAPHRSYAGIRNSAARLADQGVVNLQRTGQTRAYALNLDHLAAPAIIALAGMRREFIDRLRGACGEMPLRYAAMFGSGARGEMRTESDIDLLFITLGTDEEAVTGAIHRLCDQASGWTGNSVNPIIMAEGRMDGGDSFLREVAKDGVVLAGEATWLTRRLRKLAA